MKKKLCFIIPVYNGAKYLNNCVKSIMKKNFEFTDHQIIIINDNSNDNSLKVIQNLQKEFPIIQIINNDNNLGEGYSKNRAIERSTAKYIFTLDQDNLLSDNSTKFMLNEIIAQDSDLMIFPEVKFFFMNKFIITQKAMFSSKDTNKYKMYNDDVSFASLGNFMFKKSIWEEVGGYENVTLESLNFSLKVATKNKKIDVCSRGFYFHQIGNKGAYINSLKKISPQGLKHEAVLNIQYEDLIQPNLNSIKKLTILGQLLEMLIYFKKLLIH
jgi:glycosyltransferase involved in cell wall biosynthesis